MGLLTPACGSDGRPAPDGCGLAAYGVVRASPDALAALRKQPGPDVGKPVAPGLLRQADDQAVAAVAAVFHAIHNFGLQDCPFSDWGVAAAPCFLGWSITAAVLEKYRRLGPRSVSPLAVPNASLHAVSALISVGLRALGPNLGVGGGPGAAAEGLLTGLTLLLEPGVPGVWLALTAWDPEPAHAPTDSASAPAVCCAAALALIPGADDRTGLRLRYIPSARPSGRPSSAADLARFLAGRPADGQPRRWSCPVNGGGEVELMEAAGARA